MRVPSPTIDGLPASDTRARGTSMPSTPLEARASKPASRRALPPGLIASVSNWLTARAVNAELTRSRFSNEKSTALTTRGVRRRAVDHGVVAD